MKKVLCFCSLLFVSSFLNSSNDLNGLIQIPEENIAQIQKEFENLNSMYPINSEGVELKYNEGREYKAKETIAFSERLKSLVLDNNTRGYLLLRLLCIRYGTGKGGYNFETEAFKCFSDFVSQPIVKQTYVVQRLLDLSRALKDLREKQQKDPYEFCEDSGYYRGILRRETKKLSDQTEPFRKIFTEDFINARKIKKEVIHFLKSYNI